MPTTLLWFRRDLRLADHPALVAAAGRGAVIPVFIHDNSVDTLGAAPKWRLDRGLDAFDAQLRGQGHRLILRRGPAREVLEELVEETGADAVYWSRLYDPEAIERDARVKAALQENGIDAQSFVGHLIHEPWEIETQQGGPYRVYSPFWKNAKNREVADPLAAPDMRAPDQWPESETLESWELGRAMHRGAKVLAPHSHPGEAAALDQLANFREESLSRYKEGRDLPAARATSQMSEYLTYGEISARQIWHAAKRNSTSESFLRQLIWRDFAYHLMYHTPHILDRSWRAEWERFPWSEEETEALQRWRQGRTGVPFVDAAMREMYVTGRMHNRARMVVASYVTKHMGVHWRIGQAWFEDCLTDWDPANNAMGWQWVAGCGPDAAPYFRIFNPATQAKRYDSDFAYRKRWIAEGEARPSETALSYFDAVPTAWGLSPNDDYPDPVVGLDEGRQRALNAYAELTEK